MPKCSRTPHYNIAVLGSGPAGQRAAIQASKLGKQVVLIEKQNKTGGSSLHTGTIPSKSLRETVINLNSLKKGTHGINISLRHNITIDEFMFRKQMVIQEQEMAINNIIEKNNIDFVHGIPKFIGINEIEVISASLEEKISFTADNIIIATGSRPNHPDWYSHDNQCVFDSDTILSINNLPKKMTIVGAGVIGCEYACIFARLGIRVNLISHDRQILSFLDREIVENLTYQMRHQRITMRLGETVSHLEPIDDHNINVILTSGKSLQSSHTLVSVGRKSNTEGLGLEEIGVKLAKRGKIDVNENYQTNIEHIYAVGDVIGFPGLASTAAIQARIAVLHAFNQLESEKMPNDLPLGIWTIPAVAMVGATEEQLTDNKLPYEIGIAHFREVARANIMGGEDGILKILFDSDTLELLGVHIIGPQACELIHLGQAVMYFKGTIKYFMNAVFNYPTLDEAYRIAAFNGINRLENK